MTNCSKFRFFSILILPVFFLLYFNDVKAELTEEERKEIYDTTNFFLWHNEFSWDIDKQYYSSDYFKDKTEKFNRQEVKDSVVSKGFNIKYGLESLYQRRQDTYVAIGDLIPSLSVKLGRGMLPVDGADFFSNLLGFLLPHNWFNLRNSRTRYDVEKYTVYGLLVDELFVADLLFIDIHERLRNFEIIQFYIQHLSILNQHIKDHYTPENPRINALVDQLVILENLWTNEMSQMRGQLGSALLSLAQLTVFDNKNWKKFNIEHLEDFPTEIPPFNEDEHDQFITSAFYNSPEIAGAKRLVQIARRDKYVSVSSDVFAAGEEGSIGISLGYSSLPRYIKFKSRYRQSQINVKETYFQIQHNAEQAMLRQTRAYNRYNDTVEYNIHTKKLLKKFLDFYLVKGKLVGGLQEILEDAINVEMQINESLHDYLISQLMQKRSLVSPMLDDRLIDLLPPSRETNRFKYWLNDLFSKN